METETNTKRKAEEILEDDNEQPNKKAKLETEEKNEGNDTLSNMQIENEKSDKETMTEEDYLTDLEKIYKNYKENLKELEVEEYKKMLQKFYNQNQRLAVRCQKLKVAVERTQSAPMKLIREISKHVNPHQLSLITAQLVNNGKPPKKRVYSPQLKNVMIGLYQVSPAAHKYLSNILILPDEEEVKMWIAQGLESNLVDEKTKENANSSKNSQIGSEAQAVLDAIAFENLMSTLL